MSRDDKPSPRRGAVWTAEEDNVVDWHYGEEPLADTAGRVGRSVDAVRRRLHQRFGSSQAMQGRRSLRALSSESGYNWDQLKRAMRTLDIRPRRTVRKKRTTAPHMLTDAQCDRVLAHLGEETRLGCARLSVARAADEAGTSRATAYRRVNRLGLSPERGTLTAVEYELLLAALRTGRRDDPG